MRILTVRALLLKLQILRDQKETIGAMSNEENDTQELPIGYRFLPTDLELVKYYLSPKVLGEPIPSSVIVDIDESELYSKPPNKLEMNSCGTKEWFFFIHQDGNSHDGLTTIHMVGNGIGFWKSDGEGTFIYDCDGHKVAFKICWTYYSGPPEKGKRTHWVMSEYRLQMENECNNQENVEEWTLRRIKYDWEYRSPFV